MKLPGIKMPLFFIYFIAIMSCGCKAQQNSGDLKKQNSNNTLLWRIRGKDLKAPSYLFGTFHLLCSDDIHFSDQLRSALKTSNEVYMEMDMDDPSIMMSGLLYLNMKNGKTLKDLYSEKDYQRVNKYFSDTLHMPMAMMESAKPYFLVALLYPKMMNCSNPSGIEEELVKIIKEDKKEIQGLETMQFQASVFDSIPYEVQAKELLNNIDSAAMYKAEFDTMVNIYKNQKLDSMEGLFTKPEFGTDTYEDLLLTNRNKNWVKQLNTIMRKESVFVAVGTGHLIGNKGLLSLLKKEGYTVEPLINK